MYICVGHPCLFITFVKCIHLAIFLHNSLYVNMLLKVQLLCIKSTANGLAEV